MSTILEVFEQLCKADLIPEKRRKNFLTSLRYLAKSYDSTPEQLALTRDIEATYPERLSEYLTAQGKHLTKDGKPSSTIRNTVQEIKQLFDQFHVLQHTPAVPVVTKPKPQRWWQAREEMAASSPYKHQAWMTTSPYVLPPARWPDEVKDQYERWRLLRKDDLRVASTFNFTVGLESLLGYLHLSGEERLNCLHPETQKKLALKAYQDDRNQILATPQTVAWNDCFVLDHIKSFVTWHAWRIHTPKDAQVKERAPSKPSTLGIRVIDTIVGFADTLKRKEHRRLETYRNSLPLPRKIHDKQAAVHSFTFAELEAAALALMDEARHMYINRAWKGGGERIQHPGRIAATRFQTGIILYMACHNPMRARNWCEMILDTNLFQVNGTWHVKFQGDELKIAMRRGKTNVHELEIDPEVVPYLEEYLGTWRPMLPGADTDRHVFLRSKRGKGGSDSEAMNIKALYMRLKVHVYRMTKKRLYTHLLRTIFTSNLLSAHADINTVAYLLNDDPKTVLARYNELQAGKHQVSFREYYARARDGNGNGNGIDSPRKPV